MMGELGREWRRSSACGGSGCVDVSVSGDVVSVRATATPGVVVLFTRREWADFIAGVKAGEFDRCGTRGTPSA